MKNQRLANEDNPPEKKSDDLDQCPVTICPCQSPDDWITLSGLTSPKVDRK